MGSGSCLVPVPHPASFEDGLDHLLLASPPQFLPNRLENPNFGRTAGEEGSIAGPRPGAPSLTVGDAAGTSGHILPPGKGFSSGKLPVPGSAGRSSRAQGEHQPGVSPTSALSLQLLCPFPTKLHLPLIKRRRKPLSQRKGLLPTPCPAAPRLLSPARSRQDGAAPARLTPKHGAASWGQRGHEEDAEHVARLHAPPGTHRAQKQPRIRPQPPLTGLLSICVSGGSCPWVSSRCRCRRRPPGRSPGWTPNLWMTS